MLFVNQVSDIVKAPMFGFPINICLVMSILGHSSPLHTNIVIDKIKVELAGYAETVYPIKAIKTKEKLDCAYLDVTVENLYGLKHQSYLYRL